MTPWRAAALGFAAACSVRPAAAQQPMPVPMPMPHQHAEVMDMSDSMPGALGISMNRMGSGTTWVPDAVPLPSRHTMRGGWDLMLHGFAFLQYNWQSGQRGDQQLGSLNWTMVMASRPLAGGQFQARTMLSLDPATVTARGYPLLLQSGESYRGVPLVDRQHPHDFWMELGALYERPLSRSLGLSLYAAPAGEPALGPVAFMHRPSAMDDPVAPLGHHWQDATHISFGVVTGGVFTRTWKLEASSFNGREPDDERWGFDRIHFDSWSARLTVNPGPAWSFTAGYGHLASPEALNPAQSVNRFAASAMVGRRLGAAGQWATTVVWGANAAAGRVSHAVLLESEAVLDRRNTVLGRLELVQKSAEDLALPGGLGGFAPDRAVTVASFSGSYIREVVVGSRATLGVGVRGTLNVVPAALEPFYGSRTPRGALVFVRLRPAHAAHSRPAERAMPAMGGMRGEAPRSDTAAAYDASRIATAVTMPEPAVRAATAIMAARRPSASAARPAPRAPTTYPASRQKRYTPSAEARHNGGARSDTAASSVG